MTDFKFETKVYLSLFDVDGVNEDDTVLTKQTTAAWALEIDARGFGIKISAPDQTIDVRVESSDGTVRTIQLNLNNIRCSAPSDWNGSVVPEELVISQLECTLKF
jgi:hypothetical protein